MRHGLLNGSGTADPPVPRDPARHSNLPGHGDGTVIATTVVSAVLSNSPSAVLSNSPSAVLSNSPSAVLSNSPSTVLVGVSPVFVAGFSVFAVAFLVLIVLTLRFTFQRAAENRRSWLAEQNDLDTAGAPRTRTGDRMGGDRRAMTALVLSGGGTRGATQVGMLQVLAEAGVVPDRIYGTSVGAVNGAAFAADPTVRGVDRLTTIWRGITGEEVYPQRRGHGPWRFLQQRESMHSNAGLRRIIEAGIDFERLEDAAVPLEVVATSIVDGRERWLTSGPAVEAVLASAAIPSIFPPVDIDGDRLIDGAVVDNVPLTRAIDAGATRIIVLLCGPPTFTPPVAKRPVEAMFNALLIAVHARFAREMARLPPGVEVVVCSGGTGQTRDYTDFSETEALIAAGRREATEVFRRCGLLSDAAVVTAAGSGAPAHSEPRDDS